MNRFKFFFLSNSDLRRQLIDCSHESPYHLEGNVLTHIALVYADTQISQGVNQNLYAAAALLHDIGKPESKVEVGDKVRFSGHEGVSFYKAFSFLDFVRNYFNLSDEEINERLLPLIACHGDLFKRFHGRDVLLSGVQDYERLQDIVRFSVFDRAGSISEKDNIIPDILLDDFSETNRSDQKIYFLVGAHYSGHDHFIDKAQKQDDDFLVIDEKEIVRELGSKGGENGILFNELAKRYSDAVKTGRNIIVNAGLLSVKDRKRFKRISNEQRIAVVLGRDYLKMREDSFNNPSLHGSSSPEEAYSRMIRSMTRLAYPYHYEGFDEIKLFNS